jgi:DNA polymerase IV
LKVIKHSRVISSDQIGIRSYSTAIAAIKAYPHELSSASEIMAIPGCSKKIAGLFEEWQSSSPDPVQRKLTSVKELEESETYQVLKKFESIWGVGADTATKLYYTHGYRTIGDIISKHWNQLTRVQQIGVKYYDEFLTPVPRREMEKITALITSHAEAILPGVQTMLVGGYRRGKKESGDVDVLISHPIEGAIPSGFLVNLLRSLEDAELITHTLSVSTPSAKTSKNKFDGLDKAMLVWQTKKGRLHRRVDIIVAPAVCAGTALLGWTGGTTFERDLRLYCDKERGWKFSSEGIWQGSKRVAGTEGWREGESWEDVEKRVLETVGVGWRPPAERCTE